MADMTVDARGALSDMPASAQDMGCVPEHRYEGADTHHLVLQTV